MPRCVRPRSDVLNVHSQCRGGAAGIRPYHPQCAWLAAQFVAQTAPEGNGWRFGIFKGDFDDSPAVV